MLRKTMPGVPPGTASMAQQVTQVAQQSRRQEESNYPNFLDPSFYSGGFTLPAGSYAMEFNVVLYEFIKANGQKAGDSTLGVMVVAHNLKDPTQVHDQFLSMGRKAKESFQPDPETGKRLVPVPGGPASGLNNQTNWFFFLDSLFKCGLPMGIISNDLSVLDGIHVDTAVIPEPEERKQLSLQSTSEVPEERKNKTIPVVVAIHDDGKPWEGTGGIPQAPAGQPKPAVKPNGQGNGKGNGQTHMPIAPPATAAPVTGAQETDEESFRLLAIDAMGNLLSDEKNSKGIKKTKARIEVLKAIDKAHGGEVSAMVGELFMSSDQGWNKILNDLGYTITGLDIIPQ